MARHFRVPIFASANIGTLNFKELALDSIHKNDNCGK